MKLNGWQRLWILGSAVWLCGVLAFTVGHFPKTTPVYQVWANKTADAINHYGTAEGALQMLSDAIHGKRIRDNAPQQADVAPDEDSIIAAQAKFLKAHPDGLDFSPLNTEYRDRLAQLRQDRAHLIERAIVAAILPCLLVYLLGYGVLWVRRGFAAPRAE